VIEHATLIVSPLASRIRDAKVRRRVTGSAVEAIGERGIHEVRVIVAGEPEAIRAAAGRAVEDGSSLVVLAGGDGTIRDASASLSHTAMPVGIVPCGTGNLYATAVGVPRNLDKALGFIATGRPAAHDLGEVRRLEADGSPASEVSPFVAACGTGFDARIIAATDLEMKRRYGVAAYFIAAGSLLGHLEPVPTVIRVDGVRTELGSVVVLVANCGEAIPGVLRPRWPVLPDDGLLHVFVLPQGGIVGGIRGVLELMTAEAAGVTASGAGARMTGTHIVVETTPPGPVQVDGDSYPIGGLEAWVKPGALSVLRG